MSFRSARRWTREHGNESSSKLAGTSCRLKTQPYFKKTFILNVTRGLMGVTSCSAVVESTKITCNPSTEPSFGHFNKKCFPSQKPWWVVDEQTTSCIICTWNMIYGDDKCTSQRVQLQKTVKIITSCGMWGGCSATDDHCCVSADQIIKGIN